MLWFGLVLALIAAVCALGAPARGDSPQATVQVSVSPMLAGAQPGDVAAGRPLTITVTGTSSIASGLYVYVLEASPGTHSCVGDTPASVVGGTLQNGAPSPVGPGSFSQTFAIVPGAGPQSVCAYIDGAANTPADASARDGFVGVMQGTTPSVPPGPPPWTMPQPSPATRPAPAAPTTSTARGRARR